MTNHEKEFLDKLLNVGLQRYSAADPPPGLEDRLLTALKATRMSEQPVDNLLDAGLACYSAAEPRPGLEQRILAGLPRPAGPQPSRWLDWRWAGALATAAVAVVVLSVFLVRQPLPDPPAPTIATVPTPQPVPTAPSVRETVQPPPVAMATTRRTAPRVEQARAEMPRLETFPAPAPLSEQERLLLLFTRQTPQEAVLMAQARSQPTAPLAIAPLPKIEELGKKTEEDNN